MTNSEKISLVRTMLQNDPQATDEVLAGYLDLARDAILIAMRPYGDTEGHDVPDKYSTIHCQLAARYFSRRGGLGELEHSENGIQRVYATATDIDLLRFVTPVAKVV